MTFEHARGDGRDLQQAQEPPASASAGCRRPQQYERELQAVPQALPVRARRTSPWNEINHFTQPTSRNPKAAAKFTNIVAQAASRLQDRRRRHPRPGRRHRAPRSPTSAATRATSSTFRHALQGPAHDLRHPQLLRRQPLPLDRHEGDHQGARLQGVLAHRDRRDLQVRRLGPEASAEAPAAAATKYMFTLAKANKKIKRALRLHVVRRHDAALRRRPGRRRPARGWPTERSRSTCRSRRLLHRRGRLRRSVSRTVASEASSPESSAVDPHAREAELGGGLDVVEPRLRGVDPAAALALGALRERLASGRWPGL